jgi:AI-2 transport protein TqsA
MTRIPATRSAEILLGLAAVVVTLAGLRAASGVIGPVFLAIVLVLSVEPIRAAATRRRGSRVVAVGSVLVPAYGILIAFVGALVLSVGQLVVLLPAYSSRFHEVAAELAGALEPLGVSRAQVGDLISTMDPSTIAGGLGSVLGGATSVASAVLLIVALILFLALDRAAIERRLEPPTVAPRLADALRLFVARTQRFVIVSSVFGLIVAILDVAALGLLGVPAPWVWGLLSFVTNYVPNVGFVLGLGPPAVIALLEGGPGSLAAVVIAYSLINFTIQFLIQPKIVGDAVGLSATVTLLSFVFWALVMGPVGGLLAVPLTLLVKAVFVDADPAARWLGPWLGDGDEPVMDDSAAADTRGT